ncbi:hypothetical protein Vadar_007691 [Vaccinium darrowii]|uniref:Uncharacterized protein n=1 Tax=Vaccinium darrowii TaxID=229202 RepID=A0ACB7ZI62_9ERIC|nr:hypothetical protein Vadar_007691 [Vaccinium darrowii]
MTPTLDDVEQLLGIPTYGLAVHTDDVRDAKTLLKDLLCVSENEAKNALEEAKGGQAVMFDWLRMYFSELHVSDTDERVTYCSRACLLYVLRCTLLCDKTGSKVNVAPLALLEDVDRVSHYGWAASALAFLYRQLGQASRRDTKQLSGFLALLEAWINEHFSMFNPVVDPDYMEDHPRALRWVSRCESGTLQSYFRKLLDDLGTDQTAGYWSSPDYHSVPHSRRICTTPKMPWACSSDYLGWFRKVSHLRVGRGEGIVRGSITERVDAVLEVVDKALGNDTLQPLELRAALKEIRDILRPTRTLTTYFRRRGQGRGRG